MRPSQITDWCHEIIRSQAAAGGFYIDATMGNGKDTLMLCTLAGKAGSVLALTSRIRRFKPHRGS